MTSLLKTTSIFIGIMDMIMAPLIGIGFMILGGFVIKWLTDCDDGEIGFHLAAVIVILILLIIICFSVCYLGLILKRGSEKEDFRECLAWLHVRLACFIINLLEVVIFVSCCVVNKVSVKEILSQPFVYVQLIGLSDHIFCLSVVWKFIEELKAGNNGHKWK